MSDTDAMRLNALTDHLVHAAKMAACWDIPVDYMSVTPSHVTAAVPDIDSGKALARCLDLWQEDTDAHDHGTGVRVCTRWSSPDLPVQVVCVATGVKVGAA